MREVLLREVEALLECSQVMCLLKEPKFEKGKIRQDLQVAYQIYFVDMDEDYLGPFGVECFAGKFAGLCNGKKSGSGVSKLPNYSSIFCSECRNKSVK